MCEIDPLKKAKYTIRQYTEDEKLRMIAEAREEQQRNEKSAMSFWKKEGYREGFKEGLEEGCREGLKESLSKGIDKGVNKEKAATILRMKKSGLTDEQIMLCADCSLDMIKQVCRR